MTAPAPTRRHPLLRAARLAGRVLLGAAGLIVVAAALLTLLPPTEMEHLPFVILAAEASPLFAVAGVVVAMVLLLTTRRRSRARLAAMSLVGAAAVMELRPVTSAWRTAPRVRAELAERWPVSRDGGGAGEGGAPYSLAAALGGLADEGVVTERRVAYAAADGSPLEMWVLRGPSPGARPAIVVLYGGAWMAEGPRQAIAINRYLARRGYTVVAIDYRHAPKHRWPAQLHDVRGALALVRDSAAAWGIDPARVALLGRSSGGHLAMMAAYAPDSARRGVPVRAVVAYYAPFDLAAGYADPPRPDPIDVRWVLRTFLGGAPAEMPARYRDASPASHVRPGLPPTLLIYAGRDHLVKARFGREAAAALRGAGSEVAYVELPWAEHGFDFLPNGVGGQLALDVVERFLERVM
jgi:acetyl esterase/lipase